MTTRARIKLIILKALDEMDGQPITDDSLWMTVQHAIPGVLLSDYTMAKGNLETDLLLTAQNNSLLNRITMTLTDKGRHAISQL